LPPLGEHQAMTLTTRPSAAGAATGRNQAPLIPLLRTAKRVKRSLTPVRPSLAFQSSLEGELLLVARRLAMGRGNAPRAVVGNTGLVGVRTEQVAAILGGLTAASILIALLLVIRRAGRRGQRDR
jgi:hypothetical protein